MILASDSEGRRFGLRAGRVEGDVDPEALQREALQGAWDWLILRQPTGLEARIEHLRALGLEPLVVDTLMSWALDLSRAPTAVEASGIALREATPADADALAALVRSVFARYPNHYTANPWLDPALALEGYVEWALAHIGDPARDCQVACIDGAIVGLSCSRHDPQTQVATGVLHGVDPRFAGRGVYRFMIESSLRQYRALGCREFRIATQAGNRTVQNLWARLGFRLVQGQTTLHLMPLFGLVRAAAPEPVSRGLRDPLAQLWADEAGERAADAIQRRSLHRAQGRDPADARELRRACWRGAGSTVRAIDALHDADGHVLAWMHSERAPPAATSPH
jgi:GNAT superfamily N-acetyltransferase